MYFAGVVFCPMIVMSAGLFRGRDFQTVSGGRGEDLLHVGWTGGRRKQFRRRFSYLSENALEQLHVLCLLLLSCPKCAVGPSRQPSTVLEHFWNISSIPG